MIRRQKGMSKHIYDLVQCSRLGILICHCCYPNLSPCVRFFLGRVLFGCCSSSFSLPASTDFFFASPWSTICHPTSQKMSHCFSVGCRVETLELVQPRWALAAGSS